jgi:acyl-CoA reductase-like NAD-dependent aldehyde dehydrogenase
MRPRAICTLIRGQQYATGRPIVGGKETLPPLKTVNPATGQKLGTFAEIGGAELEARIANAYAAAAAWRYVSFAERAKHMLMAAEIL